MDEELRIVSSKILEGLEDFAASFHQNFGHVYASYEEGLRDYVRKCPPEKCAVVAAELRTFLETHSNVALREAIIRKGAGWWPVDRDSHALLDEALRQLEARAATT
jgi:hypothetical protein